MSVEERWTNVCDIADPVEGAVQDIVQEAMAAEKVLEAHIHRHIQMPMAIWGNTDLEAKARAVTQPMFFHSPHIPCPLRFANRAASICTDRGTELGLADAEGGSIKRYLPPWAGRKRSAQLDVGAVPADASELADLQHEPLQTN